MYASSSFGIQGTLSTVLAAAIVGLSGLALDRGHLSAAPAGIIEVGELAPADALPRIAMLPEIVVSAARLHANQPRAEA